MPLYYEGATANRNPSPVENGLASMPWSRRIISVIAWDGILPLAVIVIVTAVKFGFPGNDAEPLVALFVPILAAFIRAGVAHNQLLRVCHGNAPLGRQLAITGAIIAILLFEILASAFTFMKDEPLIAWVVPLTFYVVYVALILWALRPPVDASCESFAIESDDHFGR